jgi:AraC family transcriptional regulator of adaptative response / methylphosphotriester-DNA alkyltransferase methyltransferase
MFKINKKGVFIMNKLSHEEMVDARMRRDAFYDGHFYVGVQTMKIFCLPSCKARLSLVKNMVFFLTREEAINAGYRSCKRCKPDLFPNIIPDWLGKVILHFKNNISKKTDEKALVRITGVEISTIRRHFKNHYQVTPMTFHRRLRLAYAKKLIQQGGVSINELPSQCGFKSYSGFKTAFIREYGHSPGETSHV